MICVFFGVSCWIKITTIWCRQHETQKKQKNINQLVICVSSSSIPSFQWHLLSASHGIPQVPCRENRLQWDLRSHRYPGSSGTKRGSASTFGKFQNGMIAQKIRMAKGWKGWSWISSSRFGAENEFRMWFFKRLSTVSPVFCLRCWRSWKNKCLRWSWTDTARVRASTLIATQPRVGGPRSVT